ncbi:MAG: lysophospholipid acyltransferase family protein [Polyangiales bacterium]
MMSHDPPSSIVPVPSQRLREFWSTRAGQAALSFVSTYFHASIDGGEHIPRTGGALIVSNHALFALDAAVLGALIVRDYGRFPRFLADRMLWKIPGLRSAITALGALPGAPTAAESLLRAGELVIVYPGGVDDSLKLNRERYQLKWKTRAGFARVAIAAGVPVIPVVGFGIDDAYSVRGREHWIGRRLFGSPRYDLPVFFGAYGTFIPRRARHHFIALPAIDTHGDPENSADVDRVRRAAFDAIDSHLHGVRQSNNGHGQR